MNRSKFLIATLGVGLVLGLAIAIGLPAITDTMAKKYQADKIDQVFEKLGDSESPAEPEKPYVAERVDLPDIEGWYWCTIFVDDDYANDPVSSRVTNWFETDPRLLAMRDRCRLQTIKRSDPIYAKNYGSYFGNRFPLVALQNADGKVCYKATRERIPDNVDKFVTDMAKSVKFCRPKPEPTPTPNPTPPPAPDPIPDKTPDQPAKTDEPVWLLVVLGAVGVILGVAVASKNQ